MLGTSVCASLPACLLFHSYGAPGAARPAARPGRPLPRAPTCTSPPCRSHKESAGSPGMHSSWPGATSSGTSMPASAYRCLSSSSLHVAGQEGLGWAALSVAQQPAPGQQQALGTHLQPTGCRRGAGSAREKDAAGDAAACAAERKGCFASLAAALRQARQHPVHAPHNRPLMPFQPQLPCPFLRCCGRGHRSDRDPPEERQPGEQRPVQLPGHLLAQRVRQLQELLLHVGPRRGVLEPHICGGGRTAARVSEAGTGCAWAYAAWGTFCGAPPFRAHRWRHRELQRPAALGGRTLLWGAAAPATGRPIFAACAPE